MNKKTKILAGAVAIIGLAGSGIVAANASTATPGTNPMNSLVSAIAAKFNLNTSDVQKVFDDQRTQMEAQRTQAETDRITAAVTAGKLTQDQANKIVAKRAELEAQRTSLEGKTPADREATMKTQMASLKQWATDNNIPAGYLMLGGPGMGARGHGGPRWGR